MTVAVDTADRHAVILDELEESAQTKMKLKDHAETIRRIASAISHAFQQRGKVVMFGNGGSAADAQHIVAEFIGQFHHARRGLPAIALTVNTSVLTAVSNDFSYEEVFARQVEALVNPEDVVIGLSTGGYSEGAGKCSKNVVRGIEEAKKKRAMTIGLLGKSGGLLAKLVDLPLVVPSYNTQRIQEAHITIGHIVCSLVEKSLQAEGWFSQA